MSQEDIVINGELLRLRREARGWVLNDLATRACMSVKQIRQLEEGGMSSFYSAAVKKTSAKKVGALLGLSTEELFAQEEKPALEPQVVEPESLVAETVVLAAESNSTEEALPAAQEAAHVEVARAPAQELAAASVVVEESKSKTSLWGIAALFAAALAVAAYMQPQDEPDAEAAPPLQALPAEVADPASAASAADAPASSAEVVVLPASAAPAVVASAQKLAPTPAASAPRVAVPVASGVAPVVVRPASANVVTPAPAVSAASKYP